LRLEEERSNHHGSGCGGARAQLLLFLQDLIPSVFGKPLLSDR